LQAKRKTRHKTSRLYAIPTIPLRNPEEYKFRRKIGDYPAFDNRRPSELRSAGLMETL
jgi:hypothetical protein